MMQQKESSSAFLNDFRRKKIERCLRTDVVAHINRNPELIEVVARKFNIEPYYMKKVTDGKSLLSVMDRQRQKDGKCLSDSNNLKQILRL